MKAASGQSCPSAGCAPAIKESEVSGHQSSLPLYSQPVLLGGTAVAVCLCCVAEAHSDLLCSPHHLPYLDVTGTDQYYNSSLPARGSVACHLAMRGSRFHRRQTQAASCCHFSILTVQAEPWPPWQCLLWLFPAFSRVGAEQKSPFFVGWQPGFHW